MAQRYSLKRWKITIALALVICASYLVAPRVFADVSFPVFDEPCEVGVGDTFIKTNGFSCNQTDIGGLIQQIYIFSVSILGLLIFLRLLQGGLYYFASTVGSTESKGTDIVKNALFGGFILLSAHLILNTINPDLVHTNIFKLKEIASYAEDPMFYNRPPSKEAMQIISDADARAQFIAAGIKVESGVKLDGIRQSTINGVILLFSECVRSREGCDGWDIDRGTNYTGLTTLSENNYAAGFNIGVDADTDIWDFFENNPQRYTTPGRTASGFLQYNENGTGVNIVARSRTVGTDLEAYFP